MGVARISYLECLRGHYPHRRGSLANYLLTPQARGRTPRRCKVESWSLKSGYKI